MTKMFVDLKPIGSTSAKHANRAGRWRRARGLACSMSPVNHVNLNPLVDLVIRVDLELDSKFVDLVDLASLVNILNVRVYNFVMHVIYVIFIVNFVLNEAFGHRYLT